MPVTDLIKRTLTCDRPGCKTEIEWNPNPGPSDQLPKKLDDIVEVVHPKSGTRKVYCCAECTVVDVAAGGHLPPQISLANSEQAKAVVEDAKKARKLGVVQ